MQTGYPVIISIAGSDSSGGAGIQADIKSISAVGGYAGSIITALTAQNTLGVHGIWGVPVSFIKDQAEAVFTDLKVSAVKIGMLHNGETIEAVVDILKTYRPPFVVLDPVMVATSGDPLLDPQALDLLINKLFPLSDLITPNLPELASILGKTPERVMTELDHSLTAVMNLGVSACLLKGGHSQADGDEAVDILQTHDQRIFYRLPRIASQNVHGTGCSLASAIATYKALGYTLEESIAQAKHYVYQGILDAELLNIGQGHGPLNHFHYFFSQKR